MQSYTIKMLKIFITRGKKLLIYLMIMQKLDLKPFTNQNKIKQQGQDLALAQVKTGNNAEGLLNEIREIVFSLYQSKQITKKVYSNIIKSIQ